MKFLITFNFTRRPAKKIIDEAPSFMAINKKAAEIALRIFTHPELNQLEDIVMEEYHPSEVPKQNTFDYL